jgi:hypothetical protein
VATLQPDLVGYCASSPDTYDPSSPINGRFEEPGTIVGKWGLLKDATGTFNVSGTSSCGLQEWDVEATVCVNENLVKQH